jgi:23S rRNA-/tRNA-specific pseudouridylate synthase
VTVRLVVEASDPRTVGEALSRHGIALTAVADGRVFASGKRVDDAHLPVGEGDEIVVEDARPSVADVEIVSEHHDLYAVAKPSGLPTEPDRSGNASVVHALARLLRVPPDVLHAATRLDAPVSGLVVVARGRDAARRAADLKARGALRRRYIALAARAVEPSAGVWDAPVAAAPSRRGRSTVPAATRYALVATAGALPSAPSPALLAVEPITGRTHQIRLHASGAGAPLLGDAKYGGPRRLVLPDGRTLGIARVALHAARVEVCTDDAVEWTATAPFAPDLAMVWSALGGDPAAVERAVTGPPLART